MRPAPSRRRALLLLAAGAALLVGTVGSHAAAQTDAEPGLIAFNLLGDSDAISLYGGQQAAQGYPQAVSQTAHTETRVVTGPNSSALASMQWPGKFLGNLGSLIQVFGGPPEAGGLNYPVRAEASSSGPTRAEDNGAVAVAEDAVADADARIEGFDDGADFLSFGDARTTSHSSLTDGLGVTKTTATVTDIVFGGGAITIDSVVTRASVSTDGVKGVANGEAVVSGLEVAGQPATVDENGVHFAGSQNPNPVDAVGQAVIDEALANFSDGFTVDMYVSKPTTRDEGGVQEYRSGSLVILMTFGDPSGEGGDGAFIIGGSNAYAQATQGFPAPALPTPSIDPVTGPVDSGGGFTPVPTSPPSPTPGPVADETAAPEAPVPAVALPASPIARFTGVPFVMPFFVLLASVLLGRGLDNLHRSLAAAPAAACADRGDER
jgi:hypothetical protein